MHVLSGAEQPAGIAPGQAERTAAAVHAEQEARAREEDSRDRLRELDLHKTAFISSISHELRTPLTSMSGYLELLMDGEAGPLTDLQRQMLTIIDRNGIRLLALLDDLLTLSSLEAGTLSVSNERVDVASVVNAAHAAAIPMLRSRSLTCELNVDPDTGWVPGDPAQLERALGNLVSNAAKFTEPDGRILVTASATADHVILSVEDTGPGIPYEEQDLLFTRFFRSRTAQDQATQGTGLGLVIVKGIVDCHSGDVVVHSTPGRGTTVTITLPRQPGGTALPAQAPAAAPGSPC